MRKDGRRQQGNQSHHKNNTFFLYDWLGKGDVRPCGAARQPLGDATNMMVVRHTNV